MATSKGMSTAEIYDLPASVDLPVACAALGIGRTLGYQLAKAGDFPVRVLQIGQRYKVARSAILEALGMPEQPSTPPAPAQQVGAA